MLTPSIQIDVPSSAGDARLSAAPAPDATREPSQSGGHGATSKGLTFSVARTLDEVIEAWRLVYTSYRRKKLVDPNPYQIHTSRPAVGDHSTVLVGRIGELTVSTLTAILDSPLGLPLDRVYSAELTSLRERGRRLIEVGLFADRREDLARTLDALLNLMRYAWSWGWIRERTDFVIGVHPRHARFYTRILGFFEIGEERNYSAVNNQPVVMLQADLAALVKMDPFPRGIEFFVNNAVPASEYSSRYLFPASELSGSPISAFLDFSCGRGSGPTHEGDAASSA